MNGERRDEIARAEEIVFAWIRSDATGAGLKMMLGRSQVQPLVEAIAKALQVSAELAARHWDEAVRENQARLEAEAEVDRLRAALSKNEETGR